MTEKILAYFVDSAESDQGSATGKSLANLIAAIGSENATVYFTNHDAASTAYTFTTGIDLSTYDNINFVFQKGAYIDGSVTVIFPSPANIQAQPSQQIFGSSITVSFTQKTGFVSPWWWGASYDPADDSTDSGDEFQKALDTGCNVRIPKGTYSTDSQITQQTTDQVVEAYGVLLRVSADVIGWQIGVTGGTSNTDRAHLIGGLQIENTSGSSTKTGFKLESARRSKVEIDYIKGFKDDLELTASGSIGCVYNEIKIRYAHVNDANGCNIWINHQADPVSGYVYNNSIYYPYLDGGTRKYGFYVQSRAAGSNLTPKNNRLIHPVTGGTCDYAVYDDGQDTVIEQGHFEITNNKTVTIDTTTYQWTQVGATAEYYLELNGDGNPWIKGSLGLGVALISGDTVSESGVGAMAWGTVGSLGASEFGWGDPDGNGWNTLVVRTDDDSAPGNNEISFIDPNDICLGPNSENAYITIAHHAPKRITIHGDHYYINTREMWWKEFQDENNIGTAFYLEREGIQSYQNASPLMKLFDSETAAATKPQGIEVGVGYASSVGYFLRGIDVTNDVQKILLTTDGRIIQVDDLTTYGVISKDMLWSLTLEQLHPKLIPQTAIREAIGCLR